jgi:hypothetical protein
MKIVDLFQRRDKLHNHLDRPVSSEHVEALRQARKLERAIAGGLDRLRSEDPALANLLSTATVQPGIRGLKMGVAAVNLTDSIMNAQQLAFTWDWIEAKSEQEIFDGVVESVRVIMTAGE